MYWLCIFLPGIGEDHGNESKHTLHCNQLNAVTSTYFCYGRRWPRSNCCGRRWSRSNVVCHLATVSCSSVRGAHPFASIRGILVGVKFIRDAFYSGASTCLDTGARCASATRHSCAFGGATVGGSTRTCGTGVRQHIFQMSCADHARCKVRATAINIVARRVIVTPGNVIINSRSMLSSWASFTGGCCGKWV